MQLRTNACYKMYLMKWRKAILRHFLAAWPMIFAGVLWAAPSGRKLIAARNRCCKIYWLAAQFANQYASTPLRLIAEDDYVVVELQGNVMCKSGKPYNNRYCYVCRMMKGELAEITEYMDTALADAVLADPA